MQQDSYRSLWFRKQHSLSRKQPRAIAHALLARLLAVQKWEALFVT